MEHVSFRDPAWAPPVFGDDDEEQNMVLTELPVPTGWTPSTGEGLEAGVGRGTVAQIRHVPSEQRCKTWLGSELAAAFIAATQSANCVVIDLDAWLAVSDSAPALDAAVAQLITNISKDTKHSICARVLLEASNTDAALARLPRIQKLLWTGTVAAAVPGAPTALLTPSGRRDFEKKFTEERGLPPRRLAFRPTVGLRALADEWAVKAHCQIRPQEVDKVAADLRTTAESGTPLTIVVMSAKTHEDPKLDTIGEGTVFLRHPETPDDWSPPDGRVLSLGAGWRDAPSAVRGIASELITYFCHFGGEVVYVAGGMAGDTEPARAAAQAAKRVSISRRVFSPESPAEMPLMDLIRLYATRRVLASARDYSRARQEVGADLSSEASSLVAIEVDTSTEAGRAAYSRYVGVPIVDVACIPEESRAAYRSLCLQIMRDASRFAVPTLSEAVLTWRLEAPGFTFSAPVVPAPQ